MSWLARLVRRPSEGAPADSPLLAARHLLLSPDTADAQTFLADLQEVSTELGVDAPERLVQRIDALFEAMGQTQAEQVAGLARSFHDSLSAIAEQIRAGLQGDEDTVDELERVNRSLQRATELPDLESVRRKLREETSNLGRVVRRQIERQEDLRTQYREAVKTLEDKLGEAEQTLRVDPLTRLGNRTAYEYFVATAHAKSVSGQPWALAVLDMDGFKQVNDTYGHSEGDWALSEVASRLREGLPENAFLARLGGDEFTVVLRGSERQLLGFLEKVDRRLGQRPVVGARGHELRLGLSFGVVGLGLFARPGEAFAEADQRMYRHKAQRKASR